MLGMYGLMGKIISKPEKRDKLIGILLDGTQEMPGCLGYVVSKDPVDSNGIWITEIWEDKASHAASLALPSVRVAVGKGRPLIASIGKQIELFPVGGHGLQLGI